MIAFEDRTPQGREALLAYLDGKPPRYRFEWIAWTFTLIALAAPIWSVIRGWF